MKRTAWSAMMRAATLAGMLFASSARGQGEGTHDRGRYGARGTLVVQGQAGLRFDSKTLTPEGPSAADTKVNQTTIELDPVADYFVANHLSVGVVVGLAYRKTSSSFDSTASPDSPSSVGIDPGL